MIHTENGEIVIENLSYSLNQNVIRINVRECSLKNIFIIQMI